MCFDFFKFLSIINEIHHVIFHQTKNSSFSYCIDLIMLNDTNIAKAILSNCLNVYIKCPINPIKETYNRVYIKNHKKFTNI